MTVIARQTENIEIYRNDSIYKELTVKDTDGNAVDLTDYTFDAQIRRHADSDTVLVQLTVEAISAADGTVAVFGASSNTATLDLGSDDEGVWDLECVSNHATPIITTAFAGSVTFVKDVTDS